MIQTEVVLISRRPAGDQTRWVYLDIGMFNGLTETLEEAIRYRVGVPPGRGAPGPVVLAGPSCDSAGVLYEKSGYQLPVGLRIGDRLRLMSAGAYTASYSTVRVQRLRAAAHVLRLRCYSHDGGVVMNPIADQYPRYGQLAGPVVMIGFGSIGRGTLPLILRHLDVDPAGIVVVAPGTGNDGLLSQLGIGKVTAPITAGNYRELLSPLLRAGGGRGQAFCVNLSVDTSSVAILALCRQLGALYVDTVIEPWPGFYDDTSAPLAARTNYALRQTLLAERAASPGGPTAVSACGANPGMVSWFVKQALLDVAANAGLVHAEPASRADWAELMRRSGVTGIHIAERDTQRALSPKPIGTFVNTWSVDGFISEGLQPAEIGWGTHERWLPPSAHRHPDPLAPSIYLDRPGADTRVRTWCPTAGPQYGLCVTHNESISIADYFTVRDGSTATYRPTCHYAYHPADDALLSWHELLGTAGRLPQRHHVLDESEIADGIDELGVLLYGQQVNAYWFGSRLSIEETRSLAPYQNATGLQVTSAVLAAMVWALEHPGEGIVEADDIDFRRCLEVQRPYLGPVEGHFTDWTPLSARSPLFPDDIDESDPWQFRNVLVH